MAIPNDQTGWSTESKLLRFIIKQLDRLAKLIYNMASSVPTLISELTNDTGYITGAQVPTNETDPIVGAINGIPISDGAGNISTATPGTDYLTELSQDDSPQLGGDLDINGHNIDFGVTLTVNSTHKGEIMTVTVDTNSIGFGALLAQGADFHFDEADASSVDNINMLVMALETGTGSKKVLLKGQICDTSWNWSSGAVYASETSGELTQTIPCTEDSATVVVGWALSADTIYFDPYGSWATVYDHCPTTTTTTTTP